MLALASLAASAPLRHDAPLTENDFLTEQELGSVLAQPEDPASLSASVAKSSCPSNVKGLLYNHIPKTGGTVVHHMLQAILSPGGEPKYQMDTRGSTPPGALDESMPRYVYQMDQLKDAGGNPMPISSGDGHKYFVIGLVRRPCDYLLSQWVEKSNEAHKGGNWGADWYGTSSPYSSEVDKGKFHDFVGGVVNATNKAGHSSVKLMDAPFMSVGTRVRGYDAAKDGGYLHCIMYTHSLVNDFKACIRQYQNCGGQVDPTLFTDKVIEQAVEQATKDERAGGRSVGDHAPCSAMFDSKTQSAVMAIEGPTISKYNLGSCCS
jgi:hypothetical protein